MCKNKEDKDMSLIRDVEKGIRIKANSQKLNSKILQLKVVDGTIEIDDKNPLQKKWFEEFKK